MVQPSWPRNPLRAFHRPLVALLAATGLALAGLPSIPVLAASNQAQLDREVLKGWLARLTLSAMLARREPQVPPVEARAA